MNAIDGYWPEEILSSVMLEHAELRKLDKCRDLVLLADPSDKAGSSIPMSVKDTRPEVVECCWRANQAAWHAIRTNHSSRIGVGEGEMYCYIAPMNADNEGGLYQQLRQLTTLAKEHGCRRWAVIAADGVKIKQLRRI